jgi:hypothetical protein
VDDAVADEAELAESLSERERELGALPEAADDGEHLVVDEAAGALQVVELLGLSSSRSTKY